jgi:putative cardiolipin synthase
MLRPWTWNHRFHDKIILVDNKFAMIGGRNIGDRYFAADATQEATNDRDVLVINTNEEDIKTSVIQEIKDYYETTWHHELAENPHVTLSNRQQQKAKETKEELRVLFEKTQETYPAYFHLELDWLDYAFPVNQITFLHNPLENMNSEPLIWQELAKMMEQAKSSIYIETPYVIPTNKMREYVNEDEITAQTKEIHTNSLTSSPNLIAFSGYTNYREKLVQSGIDIFEFQSESESNHAKAFVFDQRISAIGSFNLDPRSTFLNTEVMLVIDSKEFAEHMEKHNQWRKEKSLQVGPGGEYIKSDHVEELEASGLKRFLNWGLSKVTRAFEFLL